MRNELLSLRITHHALRITRLLIIDCYEINYNILDTVVISSEKKNGSLDSFDTFLSRGIKKIVNYTKARPATGPSELSSPGTGFIEGLFSGSFFGMPISGAVGGSIGVKVKQKTGPTGKAIATGFLSNAVAAGLTYSILSAVLAGSFSPVATAIVATIAGMAGVSGTIAGTSHENISDRLSAGTLPGGIVGTTITGNPFMPFITALAGASGGMAKSKIGNFLASAGVGAALGTASGVTGGPLYMALNAAIGASLGVLATISGPVAGQIGRNITEDIFS